MRTCWLLASAYGHDVNLFRNAKQSEQECDSKECLSWGYSLYQTQGCGKRACILALLPLARDSSVVRITLSHICPGPGREILHMCLLASCVCCLIQPCACRPRCGSHCQHQQQRIPHGDAARTPSASSCTPDHVCHTPTRRVPSIPCSSQVLGTLEIDLPSVPCSFHEFEKPPETGLPSAQLPLKRGLPFAQWQLFKGQMNAARSV